LTLTSIGEPGALVAHHLDQHPENQSLTITIPLVEPDTGQHISELIIDLCTANVSRLANTPSFPYDDTESTREPDRKADVVELSALNNADCWGTPWVPPADEEEASVPVSNFYCRVSAENR
jgi:hypothetical protein